MSLKDLETTSKIEGITEPKQSIPDDVNQSAIGAYAYVYLKTSNPKLLKSLTERNGNDNAYCR